MIGNLTAFSYDIWNFGVHQSPGTFRNMNPPKRTQNKSDNESWHNLPGYVITGHQLVEAWFCVAYKMPIQEDKDRKVCEKNIKFNF